MPVLPEFHARCPDMQFDMGVSVGIVDIIDENVDCVVQGSELLDQSLMARKVADLPLGVFAAPAYQARAGTSRRDGAEWESSGCPRTCPTPM